MTASDVLVQCRSAENIGMMGSQTSRQEGLFYSFNLEDHIPLKSRCCPNTQVRRIKRSIHENARNVARRIATTREYRRSRRERKKIEMLLAHLKRVLKLDRLSRKIESGSGMK